MRTLMLVLLVVAVTSAPAAAQKKAAKPKRLVIEVTRVIPVSGAPRDGVGILVEDGKIKAIGTDVKAKDHEDATVIVYEGVAFPGFVDAGSYAGVVSHRDEITRKTLPYLMIADALDPSSSDIKDARAAGITTLHLMPGDKNVVGGRTAVAKIGKDGTVNWLRRDALMKVSLSRAGWDRGGPPTNLLGGLELLERLRGHRAMKPYWTERCFVAADTTVEIDAVANLKKTVGMNPLLLANSAVARHADTLKGRVRGVVIDPMLPELGNHWRTAAAKLEAAGVPFAFASRTPRRPAKGLRLSAITARMGGLSREGAWRALTLDAARLLGVADRVGSLEVGKDADILIFSHEPSDPRARLLWVIQDGEVLVNSLSGDRS